MAKKLTDKDFVTMMSGTNSIIGNFGGKVGQITLDNFRKSINANDEEVLESLAFYIDVNKASSLGTTRVDTGGNENMRTLWENSHVSCIMDANGNYCELNPNDCRYTSEGEYILNEDGTVITNYSHGDFMEIIPTTYGRVQEVMVGANTILRLWLSLVPLPGGFVIPQQVVSKFKVSMVDDKLRSLPGKVPTASLTLRGFWEKAQSRSKNHGIANLDFRNHLLFYMMSKYGWRDSQNCKGSDGTNIWGVGLDGTEGLASGESAGNNGFTNQKSVKTGHTLSLGNYDGKIAVTLPNGNTAHGVSVCGFENPWGQYWEMVGGLCSVGTDVYFWRSNTIPSAAPTADTFQGIDHVLLSRSTSSMWAMNIIASQKGQGVYMIQKESNSGISYGDYFYYSAEGQLWLWGGSSYFGANCGLASATSNNAWANAYADFSARLAFWGAVNKVSAEKFKSLRT